MHRLAKWLRAGLLGILATTLAGPAPAQAPPDPATTTTITLAVPAIAYVAPLSVDDCVELLVAAIRHLDNVPEDVDPAEVHPSVVRLLDSTRAYLRARDDRDTSPYDYEWILVARGSAEPKTLRRSFDIGSSVTRVSVIGFEAEGADIIIREVSVFDEKNRIVAGFRSEDDDPWLIQSRFPRRDLFHLWKRSSVRRVEVSFEAPNSPSGSDPRLLVLLGRSDTREYGKTAVFYCGEARRALLAGDIEDTREALLQAHKNAVEFREKIRAAEDDVQ